MKIKIFNIKGEDTFRVLNLNNNIFGLKVNNKHLVYLEIKRYLACQRQGTHKSKEKGEITGSTRKLQRQKGTGNSRKGSIKSPILRGGGRVFGPRPRNYNFKLNKSLKKLSKKIILSYKLKNEKIIVIEDFYFKKPKTKNMLNLLNAFNIYNKKSLFVLGDKSKNIYLSSRNINKVKVVNYFELNSYDILNSDFILFLETSLLYIEKTLINKKIKND